MKIGDLVTNVWAKEWGIGKVVKITQIGDFTQARVAWPDKQMRALDPVYEGACIMQNHDIVDLEIA